MNLKDKTIIITGARRIGKTVAKELAKKGANLAIIYNSSKAEALETIEECRGTGVKAEIFKTDLSKQEEIKGVLEDVMGKFGSLEGLVHMAAPYPKSKFGEITTDEFDKTMRAIAGSAILLGQEVGSRMSLGGIVFFSDWSVLRAPFKNYLVYNAAKSAIDSITKSLAVELAPNICVNAIAPGPILKPPDLTDEEDREVLAATPLAKWGGPEEIARAVIYLLESDFTTGVVLPVDGGRSIS